MSNINILQPVILAGGSGSRLWPLSRSSFPKQFLSLTEEKKETMLQLTLSRINDFENLNSPILICNEEHRFIAAEQMRAMNVKPRSIFLEPFGRNTAPAITIAALKALEKGEDPILLVLSADHIIKDQHKFKSAINKGLEFAKDDSLVTFGVNPTSPETGFGYIEAKDFLDYEKLVASKIVSFVEKPDKNTATKLIKNKKYSWNSGMFLFKASVFIKELGNYFPKIIKHCKESLNPALIDLDFQRLNPESFGKCPNLSIDQAVMEKTKLGVVVPLKAGWSDLGSWESVLDISDKDQNGNASFGKVLKKDCFNCFVKSDNRLIVTIGLNDIVVVETSDAVLVSQKGHAHNLKEIVNSFDPIKFPEGFIHRKVYRPWGHYISIGNDSRWQVKKIEVDPGQTLSLQMHHHRAEHWIIVKGTAKVEVDGLTKLFGENQSTYIPLGSKHRLSNPGKIPLTLIEVQSGAYLGEDDIVRIKDIYGRKDV